MTGYIQDHTKREAVWCIQVLYLGPFRREGFPREILNSPIKWGGGSTPSCFKLHVARFLKCTNLKTVGLLL